MVTSNKLSDKKVVKMAEQNNSVVVPQRTLLGEVNEHITCPLCRGYYIDATTIVECLHSFCRSCIIKHLQVKSYCPECEMMINSAKPNIKPDKALQDIVYKLVPGLFQREMERRQQFYASRPGPAASATPEQRGEDTERIIFSPEDVISFSLEYVDLTDTDSISSKSSDSNEPQVPVNTTRRFLQCPAVVNISHLKKFISMKFDIDGTQFAIDILYKRVPLPDYYTLMDIAYIYNWKRNEPMRFFYQIIDFIAIRSRYGLFDINRKGLNFHDPKSSPAHTDDTSDSPAPNLTEHGSETSSGANSPMPDDSGSRKASELSKDVSKLCSTQKSNRTGDNSKSSNSKKGDDEVEKSQFLNSFELTAKSSNESLSKSVTPKLKEIANDPNLSQLPNTAENDVSSKMQNLSAKVDECLKRKQQSPATSPDVKRIKQEDKPKTNQTKQVMVPSPSIKLNTPLKKADTLDKKKDNISKNLLPVSLSSVGNMAPPITTISKEVKHSSEKSGLDPSKRPVPSPQIILSPKQKPDSKTSGTVKTVSPLKLNLLKLDSPTASNSKLNDTPKPTKKMPDLKPSVPPLLGVQNKAQIGKVRMDLLANNCDPIDRSKIMSQAKTTLTNQSQGQMSGSTLKSLFDSCKINIPSSLSITLTDQKEQRNQTESPPVDPKKVMINKNLVGVNTSGAHKVPSPPVHNYIEILKLPESDPKNQVSKSEPLSKQSTSNKEENTTSTKPTKSSETSAKGPIPSLKPISDTKLVKTNPGNQSGPITFQQTFEKQLQNIQSDKTKLPKNKLQVPKLMPATPKAISAANKLNKPISQGNSYTNETKVPTKSDNALDLSTPHNIHHQLGPQQSKAFETMKSIANLAKKQNMTPQQNKTVPQNIPHNTLFSSVANRPVTSASVPLRIPSSSSTSSIGSLKTDKMNPIRQDITKKSSHSQQNNLSPTTSNNYQLMSQSSPNTAQPSPRQTRSPSSSPKLVIAEEKNIGSGLDQNVNQSNQISSTQITNINTTKTEAIKNIPGSSKPVMKPLKPLLPGKMSEIRPPMGMSLNNPTEFQLMHAMLRQRMEMQNVWIKAQLMSHQQNNNDNKQ